MPTKSISIQAMTLHDAAYVVEVYSPLGDVISTRLVHARSQVSCHQVLKRGHQVKKTVDLGEGATVKVAWSVLGMNAEDLHWVYLQPRGRAVKAIRTAPVLGWLCIAFSSFFSHARGCEMFQDEDWNLQVISLCCRSSQPRQSASFQR